MIPLDTQGWVFRLFSSSLWGNFTHRLSCFFPNVPLAVSSIRFRSSIVDCSGNGIVLVFSLYYNITITRTDWSFPCFLTFLSIWGRQILLAGSWLACSPGPQRKFSFYGLFCLYLSLFLSLPSQMFAHMETFTSPSLFMFFDTKADHFYFFFLCSPLLWCNSDQSNRLFFWTCIPLSSLETCSKELNVQLCRNKESMCGFLNIFFNGECAWKGKKTLHYCGQGVKKR